MSGILLQPEDGGEAITVSTEKTVIGRGTFMKITDKRVSRNHASLEINDKGRLTVTPVHTNPCFLRALDSGEKLTLPKDEPRVLEHGDVLGLLPDTLYYKVIYEDEVTKDESSNKKKTDSAKPDKQESEEEDEEEEDEDDEEEEEEDEDEMPTKVKINGNEKEEKPDVKTVKSGNKEMALPVDKRRSLPKWMVGAAKRVAIKSPSSSKDTPAKKPQTATNARGPKRKAAAKADYDEVDDFDSEAESPPPARRQTPKKGGRGAPKRRKASSSEEDWEEEEESPRRRGARGKQRGRRKRYDSDEEEEATPRRQRRASTVKQMSYTDEIVFSDSELEGMSSDEDSGRRGSTKKDQDSDFVMDEPESGSDWEVSHSQSSKRGKRRGRPSGPPPVRGRGARSPRGPGRAGRGRTRTAASKRRSYAEDSDDFSDENGEAYVPRPSKSRRRCNDSDESEDERPARGRGQRRAASESDQSEEEVKKKPQGRRGRPAKKKREESEEDDWSEEEVKKTPVAKGRRGRPQKKQKVEEEESEEDQSEDEVKDNAEKGNSRKDESEEEEDEEEDNGRKKAKSKHRKSCWYGKKCYRKNPKHFEEFCHPDDDSFEEEEEEEKEDKPPKKAAPASRDKREKDKKSVLHNASDDDGEANTYDYNDSFIAPEESADRVGSSSASERPDDEDDDDWDPEEESVGSLVREAKSFQRNKKMQKPVSTK